jgi:hypothetical protein
MAIPRGQAPAVLACATLMQLAPVAARAQLCAGTPSLRERPVFVSGDVARGKDAWSVGAGLTAGRDAFAGVHVERATYQNVSFAATQADTRSTDVGGVVGYEFRLGRMGVCPVAAGQWESGPDGTFAGNRLNSDGWTVGGGVTAGGVLRRTAGWRVIPYASVTFERVSSTVHDYPFVGTDSHAHDTGWVFGAGFGVVIGSRVTLGPSVTVPTGIEGGETTFGFGVDVGLGGAKR